MIYLRPLSKTDGMEFYNMLQHIGTNENGFINRVNGVSYADFSDWLNRQADISRGVGLKNGQVSQNVYWLMDEDVPIGIGKLRHRLTDALKESGGHIGYAVAYEQRGRGYGKKLLKLLLSEARRIGITEDILITIKTDNTASIRVAEYCRGELRRKTDERVYYWFSAENEERFE